MKVLLLTDIQQLGKKGEIKEVSEGYARNFLIRQGKASVVTSKTLEMVAARKRKEEKIQHDAQKAARKMLSTLNGKTVVVYAKVAGGTTLYSAVSPLTIADTLEEVYKIEIETMDIIIDAPLKVVGTHRVGVRCGNGLVAWVTVVVEASS
jgi:large subunit ribosomal protein L9